MFIHRARFHLISEINYKQMKAFVERLFEEMELSLKEVAKEASSEIQKAEKCGRVVHAILLKLKRFMSGYQFNDSTE